jgi:nickel-dependent lactate racemase
MVSSTLSLQRSRGSYVGPLEVRELIARACPTEQYSGKKVLLLVPDATRTCPLGLFFTGLFDQIGRVSAAFDVMIALGTHPPMSDEAICRRLEISPVERCTRYRSVRFFNHAWDDPGELRSVGRIAADEIEALSDGLFSMDVDITVNRRLFEYDQVIIVGPVFPHEVIGFSGGNKYLFPGVSGPEVLHFFHWLGAVVTNPMIIGNKHTPVRKVVDRAASMITMPKLCFCLVVEDLQLAGVFVGSPENAWEQASYLSKERHIVYKEKPFDTVLSCAPRMYEDLWVAGKCMYKLEPVVADGGEVIIYAPHIREISPSHGRLIRQIGYHCRDYFRMQWDKYRAFPWGVLAHSTHVRGIGTYDNGVECDRVRVTLATGIPKDVCAEINLGYRDPATIDPADYANREDRGVLLVPRAGETLYHLRQRPTWAREV